MPANWQQFGVNDLIDRRQLLIGDGYRAKNEELANSGPPFARASNINNGFRFNDADRFPERNLGRVGNKVSQPGDVVFTSKGTVGRFAFVRPDTPRFVYSPQLCFWRSLDTEVVDPRFLYYWMSGREFYHQFTGVAGQTDMADYVSLSDQRSMHITLPGIGEQRAIAHALGSLDDKIELNRRMNETLEGVARAIFKSWFVDFDTVRAKLDGRESRLPLEIANMFPDRLVESEIGEIPMGWGVVPLDKMGRFLNGLALQKFPPLDGRSLPVIKIAQLRSGSVHGADRASAELDPDYIVEDGDLLFSWSGSLECVFWAGGRGALNQHLFKVTSQRYPLWLLYFGIHQHLEGFRQIAAGKATTMGHIQRHHLSEAKVASPSSGLLKVADGIFSPLVKSLWRRRLESRTVANIRDALLPKLLSGEISVNAAREAAGAA